MKKTRQNKIVELIEKEAISTQEELLQRLNATGFPATQATISRDIKALRLHKVQDSNGFYRYIRFSGTDGETSTSKSYPWFNTSVKEINFAGNIIVVKCKSGTAGGVCADIDEMELSGIVGTLAGDDTIFILVTNEKRAEQLRDELLFICEK